MLHELYALVALVPMGLTALAILMGPGLLILLALRTPVPTAVALSPAVGLVPLSVTSAALEAWQIPWSLPTALCGVVISFAVFWILSRRFSFPRVEKAKLDRVYVVGLLGTLLGGSLLAVIALHRGMGSIEVASQGWDPIFHMNAVQWIRESGNATPWSVSPIYGGSSANYYPVGWHLIASLIPGDVVAASNVLTLLIGGVLWPIGLTYLASAVFPGRPIIWLLTPLLAASYISFPYAQLMRSGQWPNGFGTALVPAALAILIMVLRMLFTRRTERRHSSGLHFKERTPASVVGALALTGTAIAHPGALMALAVAALPFAVAYWLPWLLDVLRHRSRAGVISLLAAAGLLTITLTVLSRSSLLEGVMRYERAVRAELPDSIYLAIFDLATFPVLQAPDMDEFNTYVGLLAIAGALVGLFHKDRRALAVAWTSFVLLHLLAAGPENPARWLTGFWYKDTQRIAPMITMTGVLLAAWILDASARKLSSVIYRMIHRPPASREFYRTAAVVALTLVAVTYLASDNYRSAERIAVAAKNYRTDEAGLGVLSAGEQEFISATADRLPEDAVVVGDPFNGETFFYTLAQRRVVYTQLGSATSGQEAKEYLRTAFNQIHTDPAVCRALGQLGVTHFYQDRPGISHGSDALRVWPGFYGTNTEEGFEVLATDGTHSLYKITAC
jgi:hypothetical protein